MKSELWKSFDFEKVNDLLEGFNKTTGFVTALLDLEGNVLSKSGWRQICTEFHRVNKETAAKCRVSDTVLAGKMGKDEKYHFYECLNGLVDVAVPVIIDDEHIANLFSGQFFFENPNLEFFEKQAEKYGFNKKVYLDSLQNVPVIPKEKVIKAMDFLLNMTQWISEMTYQKMTLERLNDALKTSEERWQFAIDGSGQGLWDWNAEPNKVFYSDHLANMLGYNTEDLKDKMFVLNEKVHPDDRQLITETMNKHVAGELPIFICEHRMICKDGSVKWVLDRGKVMTRDENNNVQRIIGTYTDITEMKKKEQELRESEQRFLKIFNNSPIGVNLVSITDNISLDINDAYLKIIGYSREEVVGKTAEELNLFVDFELRSKWVNELKEKGRLKNQMAQFRAKSGEIKDIMASIEIIELEGKKVSLIAAVDVTDKIRAEEELKKLNENLEKLVEERTHELNQKMAKIEKMNNLFVGRELRMKELKDRIKDLEEQIK